MIEFHNSNNNSLRFQMPWLLKLAEDDNIAKKKLHHYKSLQTSRFHGMSEELSNYFYNKENKLISTKFLYRFQKRMESPYYEIHDELINIAATNWFSDMKMYVPKLVCNSFIAKALFGLQDDKIFYKDGCWFVHGLENQNFGVEVDSDSIRLNLCFSEPDGKRYPYTTSDKSTAIEEFTKVAREVQIKLKCPIKFVNEFEAYLYPRMNVSGYFLSLRNNENNYKEEDVFNSLEEIYNWLEENELKYLLKFNDDELFAYSNRLMKPYENWAKLFFIYNRGVFYGIENCSSKDRIVKMPFLDTEFGNLKIEIDSKKKTNLVSLSYLDFRAIYYDVTQIEIWKQDIIDMHFFSSRPKEIYTDERNLNPENSPYYDDALDMDQQSQGFWDSF